MGMAPYERLEAWKVCHELALAVYRQTSAFPRDERYGLTAQIRRAAVSIPTNIVEGAARKGRSEFRRYLDIARASLAELEYLLRFCRDLGILNEATFGGLVKLVDHAGRLTWGLYRSMKRP